jgi:hypothetical protein
VLDEMTVKQPVAGGVRRPGHRHRRAASNQLGHHRPSCGLGNQGITHGVATGIDAIVEAVQMQRVATPCRVDEAPLNAVAHHMRQTLRVRPGASVEHQYLFALLDRRSEGRLVAAPQPHNEHPILRGPRSADTVNDDRAAQLSIRELREREGVARRARRIEIRPRRGRANLEQRGLPRGDVDAVHFFRRPVLKAVHSQHLR